VTSVKERVAIIFMTVSVIATVALGAAVAHELGRKSTSTVVGTAAGNAAAVVTPGADQAGGGGTSNQPAATGSSPTIASGPGATSANGAAPATGVVSAPAGQLSNSNIGVNNGLITVGGIYDETGPFDATVERDTVRAYFDKVNAAGGVNGYKFQLLDCDSGYDPSRAHQCSQRLLSQHVLAMVGWLSVSGEEAESSFLNSQGVPIIGGLGVPSEFQVPLSWQAAVNFTAYGTAMGAHAADLGIKAPAIVVLNVPFIKPVEQALLAGLHAHGIKEKSLDEVDPTKPDYTDLALKAQTEGADSVIAALDPFSYARFFQALSRENYHPKFLGLGLDKTSANQAYGGAVYGAESLTPFLEPQDHANDPNIADYESTVRQYFPSQVAALDVYTEGDWIAAHLFTQAVGRIGTAAVTRQSLAAALNTITNFQTGLTIPLSYSSSNHAPNHCFQWIHNLKGVWTTYSDWKCF
jgi:branched-chain amino acid transport system substrate-binding protein